MSSAKTSSKYLTLMGLILSITFLGFNSCREKKTSEVVDEEVEVLDTNDGFELIFDGTSLTNWDGDPTYWRVEDGNLIGEVTPETLLKRNTFIIYQGDEPADFELKTEFRISENGNSGINYRSDQLDTIPFALRGYQADIDGKNRYTGQNYEERKRTTLAYRGEKVEIPSWDNADGSASIRSNVKRNAWQSRNILGSLGHSDSLKTKINVEDWNECHLIVKGNRMQHYINGILMSDITDNDLINRKASGKLGVQVHVGPPMQVAYRNIRMKKL